MPSARRSFKADGPAQVSAVSTWLRVAQGTSGAAGYSLVPDIIAGNNADQSDDDRKPAAASSASGLPLLDFSGTDVMSWPLAASNNGLVTTGFHTHLVPDSVTGQREIIAIWDGVGGASGKKFTFETNGATVRVLVFLSGAGDIRSATTGNVLTIGTPVAVGFEYNGGLSAEADKCVITVDGVAQVVSFAQFSGTATAMPAALISRTGFALIGGLNNQDNPTLSFDGRMGPNILGYASAMAGVTSGLLTANARLAISNFERP